MRAVLILVALVELTVGCIAAHGQFVYFDRKYDSGITGFQSELLGQGLLEVEDGYFFAAITLNNQTYLSGLYLVRTDLHGEIGWERVHQTDTVSERFNSMIEVADGNYVLLASVNRLYMPNNDGQACLAKITPSGEMVWKHYYGTDTLGEVAVGLVQTTDHGFALAGQRTISPQSNANGYLVRTDSEGNLLWEREYGGNSFDMFQSLVQTIDLGFLLLGWTRSFGDGQRDFYLVKTDSLGNQEWQRTYGGAGEDVGSSILELVNGNYLLTGGGTNSSVTTAKGFLYEVSPTGQQVWHKQYASGTPPADHLFKSIQLQDGSIVSCGLAENSETGGNAGWLLKTDSQGNLLWQRIYDYNSNTDLFYTLIATSDGGFLLGGQAKHDFPLTQDAWLLKVDSVGCTYADCLVGVDELNSSKVVADVWPNPASSILNIEWQKAGEAAIRLFDMTGKQVLRQSGSGQRARVEVSALPSGLYVLQLVQGEAKSSLKIVVQH